MLYDNIRVLFKEKRLNLYYFSSLHKRLKRYTLWPLEGKAQS